MMSTIPVSSEVVRVGIAQGNVVRAPQRISTTGLGSCVGLVLYDEGQKFAGLVHIMLPSAPRENVTNVCKYADTGTDWLVSELTAQGVSLASIRAKMAGGAQMFAATGQASEVMRVGPRNVEAVREALARHGIPLFGSDVGGNAGRTIEFDVRTETMSVRTALSGTYCF
ncbi:MAG: chemotaxis protein CheD [Alicyclobacillaceae bacterium]|jgi:chemotaxis protein CheD|nr:chemotaxis protein CheD [Alicyclobacillaceae bacterium]